MAQTHGRFSPRPLRTLAAAALAVATGACAGNGMSMSPGQMQHHTQMMAMLDAASRGEVEEGRLALARAASPEVRRYAQMMVDEHTAALQNHRAVMQAMGMTAAETDAHPAARMLADNHARAMQLLSSASGAAFDRMYMQRQADMHAYLLRSMGGMMEAAPAMGMTHGSAAPAGGISPASGGYAVPLSCDPGLSGSGPGSGRSEAGTATAENSQPRGSCGTPEDRPPLNGASVEKGNMTVALDVTALERSASEMLASHLAMAQEVLRRM